MAAGNLRGFTLDLPVQKPASDQEIKNPQGNSQPSSDYKNLIAFPNIPPAVMIYIIDLPPNAKDP
jgi:hypothetical protein